MSSANHSGEVQAHVLDLEVRWPDLFTGLTQKQRRAVAQAFAAAWHEGWHPNRADVQNLTSYARDAISHEEFLQRVVSRRPDATDQPPAGTGDRP